jgi:hypothetical protein
MDGTRFCASPIVLVLDSNGEDEPEDDWDSEPERERITSFPTRPSLVSISIPFPSIDPFSRIDQSTFRSEIVIVLELELVLEFSTVNRRTGNSANAAFCSSCSPMCQAISQERLPVNPRTQAAAPWRKVA